MDLQDRVTELESRLAFQDDTIETLNDILVTQQRAVERLQLQMTALLKRQEEMGGQFESSEEHDGLRREWPGSGRRYRRPNHGK